MACVPWFSPTAHARTGEVQGAIWWGNTNYYCLDADKNRAVVEQRPLIDQTQAPIVLNGMELACAYATMVRPFGQSVSLPVPLLVSSLGVFRFLSGVPIQTERNDEPGTLFRELAEKERQRTFKGPCTSFSHMDRLPILYFDSSDPVASRDVSRFSSHHNSSHQTVDLSSYCLARLYISSNVFREISRTVYCSVLWVERHFVLGFA